MRLEDESYAIDPGTLVMNNHHGLLRFGVVDSKRIDDQGWSHCTVNWLADDVHLANVEWNRKLDSSYQESATEMRVDYLQPVSPRWLENILNAYGDRQDERRTENVVMATGQCVVHWLYPPPRGGIAIFDSMSDFVKVHIEPHPANQTIITYQDGHKDVYGTPPSREEDSL